MRGTREEGEDEKKGWAEGSATVSQTFQLSRFDRETPV